MKIQHKLFLAMMPTALVLVVIGIFAASTISYMGEQSQIILKDNFLSVLAVQKMMEALERLDSAALFGLTGKASESRLLIERYKPIFESELKFQQGNITEPGESELTGNLLNQWKGYGEACSRLSSLEGDDQRKAYHDDLYPKFLELKGSLEKILSLNQDAMVCKSDRIREFARKMTSMTFWGIIAASLIGIMLTLLLGKASIRPLSVLTQTVRRVGGGDLEARAVLQGEDEIAQLAKEFNTMTEKLLQYQRSSLGDLLLAQTASQSAIDSLPNPVMIFDLNGNTLSVNKAAEADLRVPEIFRENSEAPEGLAKVKDVIEKVKHHVLSGNGNYIPKGLEEAVQIPSDEGEKFFLPRATTLLDGRKIIGVTVILDDITRLRRFDQLKNDLVATVAHEFRTPLTSLRMGVHLLLERAVGDLTEKQEELLFATREDCERLHSLVEELLDLSRIQSGKIRMQFRKISAQALVDSTILTHRLLVEESGRNLGVSIEPEELYINADPERIQLVLKNLLVNAIRYSAPSGNVRLILRKKDSTALFELIDDGQGIPQEFHDRIFEKFFRVPGTPGPGSGLGLSISREILEAHGGKIGISSEAGKGSNFWFSLPLVEAGDTDHV